MMPRKTKAQLAAEAEEAAAEAENEGPVSTGNEELDALLARSAEAGEEAAEDLDEEFDLSELRDAEESAGFDAFAASVVIECTRVEARTGNSSGDRYLKITWVVSEGEHAKAHIWDTVMLQGKGVGFGKRKLRELGIDLSNFKRSDLVGVKYNATTKIKKEKADSEYDDKTVIKKYGDRVDGPAESTEALP